jgi:hypothetical protein
VIKLRLLQVPNQVQQNEHCSKIKGKGGGLHFSRVDEEYSWIWLSRILPTMADTETKVQVADNHPQEKSIIDIVVHPLFCNWLLFLPVVL